MTAKQLSVTAPAEILRLHGEIVTAARQTLKLAMRAGELLAGVRAELPHGEWLPWCKANLPFSDRTARNYIRVYEQRDLPKLENVSSLSAVYAVLNSNGTDSPFGEISDEQMKAFLLVAQALRQIRDNRLYRGQYATWAHYCQGCWHIDVRDTDDWINIMEAIAQ